MPESSTEYAVYFIAYTKHNATFSNTITLAVPADVEKPSDFFIEHITEKLATYTGIPVADIIVTIMEAAPAVAWMV